MKVLCFCGVDKPCPVLTHFSQWSMDWYDWTMCGEWVVGSDL